MISHMEIRISKDVCRTCKYGYSVGGNAATHICEYYLTTSKHRWAHDDGTCGVYEKARNARHDSQKRGNAASKRSFTTRWDTEQAFEMWLAGERVTDIARVVGCEPASISNYARNHWKERKQERERNRVTRGKEKQKTDNRRKNWDKEKAAEMYANGAKIREIAETVGIRPQTISAFAAEHWEHLKATRKANGGLEQHQANWDTDRAKKLYAEGWMQSEIAKEIGVGESAISAYAAKHWQDAYEIHLGAMEERKRERQCRNKTDSNAGKTRKRKRG